VTKPDISAVYDAKSPDESKQLYADWAESYDADIAGKMDFRGPDLVAELYAAEGGAGPVLDAGAGTGLVGVALAGRGIGPVDGTDLSPEMLAVAQGKGVYRRLFEGNLNDTLDVADGAYAGVVSSGTFTTAHVGPDALDELIRVARRGALFVIAINATHFAEAGFAAKLEGLADAAGLRIEDRRYYGDKASGEHKDTLARIAVFRKA
jgi:predicted TPR repeat methyltransferase